MSYPQLFLPHSPKASLQPLKRAWVPLPAACMAGIRSPPTSFTLHSSASKVATMATILLALHLLCSSIHPFSDAQKEGPLGYIGVPCSHLCSAMKAWTVVNEGERKKEWLTRPWCLHHAQSQSLFQSLFCLTRAAPNFWFSICMEYLLPFLHFSVYVYP